MTRLEFEQMAAQIRALMLKVAQDFFESQDDAEDVAQEAMVQLWQYCEHIDSGRNVKGLAVRVAKNCCISLYRKRQTRTAVPLSAYRSPLQADSSSSPQEQLEAEDTQRMMNEVISLLKPRERQLFEMRQVEGLSTEEISQQTGIPKASVTVMVLQARKKVLIELKKMIRQ